jgi:hypothetical protein
MPASDIPEHEAPVDAPAPRWPAVSWAAAVLVVVAVLLLVGWIGRAPPAALRGDGEAFVHDVSARATPPRVVVMGSSVAETDIDVARLADALGVGPDEIARMRLQGSSAPHWLAAWERRVAEPGLVPEMVVIVAGLGQMLQARVVPGVDEALLLGELPKAPSVALLRPLGCPDPLAHACLVLAHARAHAAHAWSLPLDGARRQAARFAGASPEQAELLRRGLHIAVVPDLDVVRTQSPEVQAIRLYSVARFNQTWPVADTPLPDLLAAPRAAARRAGRTPPAVVLVRVPLHPDVPFLDDVPDAREHEVRETAEAAGALYVSPGQPPDSSWFDDPVHLDARGAAWLTETVTDALRARGWAPLQGAAR